MNNKIAIILYLSLLIRLYHISFPVGGWHEWRQADTAAIAKNFYESGSSILYPQVDWRGTTPGYVESEFQIYPYSVSLLYNVFGMHDYFGRLVSVLFSLFSVYGLYLLVRKIISENTALWASFIYTMLPLNIYFSRVFMPESTMLMCSIYGIYFFLKWTEENYFRYLMLSTAFITLAALVKLPALYLGLPLAFLVFKKYRWKMFIKWEIILMVSVVFSCVAAWYYHAHSLSEITGLSFNIWNAGNDKWGMTDLLIKPKFYNDIFLRNLGERHLTYAGFVLFIWGLFIKRQNRYEMLFDFYVIAFLIFIFIAPQAHLEQDYYQLPFNIPASVFIAKVFSKYLNFPSLKPVSGQKKPALIIVLSALLLIPVLSFVRYYRFMEYEDINSPLYKLTADARTMIPEDSLVISVSDNNPVNLYLSRRKGWVLCTPQINAENLSRLKHEGAKFVMGEKKYFKDNLEKFVFLRNACSDILDLNEYFIFRL
ncbi:MAG: glycosyltransferase family 39 protein [Bacteroidetes bacterium]|nr:glycosyltransferase family 39 protein [Bacteroidota bacterium]